MSSSSPTTRWPLTVFALALALLTAFGALHEVPAPLVHDEYAYLLSADTFVHGRLTNPPHPLAIHFETFHVFFEPTYQAKYPPAQGLTLALGQVIGHPIFGVWLSWAAALAAVTWMLGALLPARWALLGAGLLLFNPYLFFVWGQSYWGGALAAAGGALLFGGLLHARRRSALCDGLALAAGIFLLGNSRPFEGILTGVFALGLLLLLARERLIDGGWNELARRVLAPAALGLALLIAWTLYYDWRLTGNPFQLPYFAYHPELSPHEEIRSYTGSPARSFAGKSLRLVDGLLGLPLAFAFPFLLRRHRDAFVLPAAVASYLVALAVLLGSRAWPHYVAPVTGLLAFLGVTSLRGLASLRLQGWRVGRAGVVLVLLLHAGLWLYATGERIARGPLASWARDRIDMIASLEARGGKHLVLVRYGPERERNKEWIYNAADIDAASVVWARDLGPEGNRALLEYYPDRSLWMVEVPPYRPLLRAYVPQAPETVSTREH